MLCSVRVIVTRIWTTAAREHCFLSISADIRSYYLSPLGVSRCSYMAGARKQSQRTTNERMDWSEQVTFLPDIAATAGWPLAGLEVGRLMTLGNPRDKPCMPRRLSLQCCDHRSVGLHHQSQPPWALVFYCLCAACSVELQRDPEITWSHAFAFIRTRFSSK